MSREKKIQFNVNEKEYERLKSYAESEGWSITEVLRDDIKTLTPPKGGCTTSHDWSAWDVVRGLCKSLSWSLSLGSLQFFVNGIFTEFIHPLIQSLPWSPSSLSGLRYALSNLQFLIFWIYCVSNFKAKIKEVLSKTALKIELKSRQNRSLPIKNPD